MAFGLTNDWLTKQEAAQYLRVTVQTIDRWRKQGLLEARQVVKGGNVRISASSVEKLLEAGRCQSLTQ